MNNTTYIKLLRYIELFADQHPQIKKFGADFEEQMPNFATQDEKYPILFVAPQSSTLNDNLSQFVVTVYCVDIIQKDRANINFIISDTQQILNDLHKYFKDGPVTTVDILQSSSLTPINNALLDYVAGWSMTITFEVETYTICEIPFIPGGEDSFFIITENDEIITDENGNFLIYL